MVNILKYIKSDKGQSIIEFTLAFPIFALVFFAVVEFSHLFYVKLALRHALQESGRYMVTGQGRDPNDPQARCNAIDDKFKEWLIGTGAGLQGPLTYEIIVDEPGSSESPCGGPRDTVRVTAQFIKPWFTILFDQFSPGGITLNVSVTWINEPFPAGLL